MKIPFDGKKLVSYLQDDDVEVTLKDGWTKRRIAYVVLLITLAVLFIARFADFLTLLSTVASALLPFFAGAIVAYLLNLIMGRLESVYFPKSTNVVVVKSRRLVCLIISLLIVGAILTGVGFMVSGQIAESVSALFQGIAAAFQAVSELVTDLGLDTGWLAVFSNDLGEWEAIVTEAIDQLGGVDKVVTSAFSLTGALTSGVFDGFIAIVFAIYLLLGKERVKAGAKTLGFTVLPHKWYDYVCHACSIVNDCFSRFITGQCLEATILGSLCAIGMSVMGIPYAVTIGILVGLCSLVPLVGAWVGGIIGALMILPISFQQALIFVLFLVILQQIEGNFIYPRVVGGSVGVSGIWVLLAVFVGGTLFGVAGVLFGVPIVATASRLLDEVWKRPDGEVAEPVEDAGVAQGEQASDSSDGEEPVEDAGPVEYVLLTEAEQPVEVVQPAEGEKALEVAEAAEADSPAEAAEADSPAEVAEAAEAALPAEVAGAAEAALPAEGE